jgi:hypothetical protein
MATDIRNKYHIAINTIGYILRGAPNAPAYTRSVIPSQVNRLAISDINYSDFAGTGLFYTAQTDWSGGVKDESIWRDDAKYYYSHNIDTYSKPGAISVEKALTLNNDFGEALECGGAFEVDSSLKEYVGTGDDGSGNVKIYRKDAAWTDIAGTDFNTSQNYVSQLIGHKNTLYALTVGNGNDDVVASYDGSSWTDHSAAILVASTMTAMGSSRCGAEAPDESLYIFVHNNSTDETSLMKTVDNGANWTEELYFISNAIVISCAFFNSNLYYLQINGAIAELRMFDIATSAVTTIWTYYGASMDTRGVGDKYLKVFQGKLIITIPTYKIYSYDGSSMDEIWALDNEKFTLGEAGYIITGCTAYNDKLYWKNLIYDGESFFNFKRPNEDSNTYSLEMLYVNQSNLPRYVDNQDNTKLWDDATTYKATTANNAIVFNEMSPVVSIDKLLYSVTVIFNKMVSGDVIKIEYSINNRSTWTTAATLTYTTEGGTNTKREIIIPGNILFNKIWWRVSIANTGGATSPTLLDLIMAYRPMPDYKNQWQVRLNMSDGVKLLNRQNDERDGADLSSQLWNEKLVKRKVKFQDIDYAECSLKTSMTKTQTSAMITSVKKLPAQGRIRAVSGSVAEEMYYTSAKADRIMGITRGARGTTARAYLSGQVLDNGYDVYVEDITTSLNFTDEEKTESVAQVLLIES